MTNINTETETVVKKILPYLERRGYEIAGDLDFETSIRTTDRYTKGYIDILVTLGKEKPVFLIEAKKISKTITTKDRDQALTYANSVEINVPFVVITNGIDIHCYNTKTKTKIQWDGKSTEKIPTKEQLKLVVRTLKSNPLETNITISNDPSLPFRPGLPLRQLNALFYKCHSAIRKIEKNEEHAFSDFSKLLFLKLLEEKSDIEADFSLPYSYRFHELAQRPAAEADQVKDSILSMIASIVNQRAYGEVLQDKVKLKNPKAFHYIVKELSAVSFYDCSLDSKGAAFEYFVRATLKGKKLGQYFTPRELVQTMLALVGRKKIINSVISGGTPKILDPACGTGGFLVFLMQESISQLTEMLKNRDITKATYDSSKKKIKESIFYGSDANEGVAASAKMNMIIAGDGHTNIQHEDSLARTAKNWDVEKLNCDIILTNPPFGTSETDSLSAMDWTQFEIRSGKGQHLFLQKMIKSLSPGTGEICTVIDEGVLNTESSAALRKWILQQCRLKAIVSLPNETFKPNKINVKSSLLYLERRTTPDLDLEEKYKVVICKIDSLGYIGSGEKIRSFDFTRFFNEIASDVLNQEKSTRRKGYNWSAFDMDISLLHADKTFRFDYKYWEIDTLTKIEKLKRSNSILLKNINTLPTIRGSSPPAENYVDEDDGFAIVIKSGSNISRQGTIVKEGADYIEKSIYDEYVEKAQRVGGNLNLVQYGDVLLSSTGDGTLGKCAVYDSDRPAIADGHITIIRPDISLVDPYYLCDYLRAGFGAVQVTRSFTGSTGMIELTPDQVDDIVVDLCESKVEQTRLSKQIRSLEDQYLKTLDDAEALQLRVTRVLGDI